MNRPDPAEILTVHDIPAEELPHGAATILTVYDQHGRSVQTALIDKAGVVRSSPEGDYFPSRYSAEARD